VAEDGEEFINLPIDYLALTTGEPFLTPRQEYQLYKRNPDQPETLFNFTYGYAITCWKAQGSQWNKVLLLEEGWPLDKSEHQRYLYTGITRAVDKVVVVRK